MKPFCALLTLLFAALGTGQFDFTKWEKTDFRHKLISMADLTGEDQWSLRIVRGIVFGKHGRIFKDRAIQDWLEGTKWYKKNRRFNNSMLNDTERKNLDVIREAEAKRHAQIEPGDMRFWRKTAFTKEQVGDNSLIDLRIMRAEIEAIHGRTFPEEPQIQAYFDDRYWYKPAKKYDPSQLTAIERKNIATLHEMEKEKRKLGLQPGVMRAFTNKPITPDQVDRLSLNELRLLRNEVYALEGRKFKTKWLADYFLNFEWYKPTASARLNPIEERNVAVILKKENSIHDSLAKEVVPEKLLEDLWLEDVQKLRNEIYARHGKVFKQKWLQSYFESLPWYRRNPNYSEKVLTDVERKNVKIILAYEKDAQSQFDLAEG